MRSFSHGHPGYGTAQEDAALECGVDLTLTAGDQAGARKKVL
jgi:hypothetical protein